MMRVARHFGPAVAGLAIIVSTMSLSTSRALHAVRWTDRPPAELISNGESSSGTRLHAERRRERALDDYAGLQRTFVENRGQTDARVRYFAHGARYGFYLTRDALMLSFAKSPKRPCVNLALRFLDANPKAIRWVEVKS